MSKYPQTLLSCPIAQDGDRSAVPVTALEAGTGRLSQEEGWGKWNSLPIGEGGIPPKRDDFNSVLYLLSSFLVWYQQGGLMNYSATLDYEPGNEVLVGTVKYRCIKANGPSSTVKSPTDQANSAYWSNQDVGEVRYDKAQSLTTSDQARARKNIDVQSTSEVAKQLADAIKGFVAFDKAQSLSNEQKAQARTNIGVTSSGDMNDAIEEAVADVVKHTPQSLNANQQAQARKNIGAISAAEAPAPNLTPYLTKADAASTYLGINAKAASAAKADSATTANSAKVVPWTGVSGKPQLIPGTGDAGTITTTETVVAATTVSDTSARSMSLASGGTLTVNNGSANKAWITVVALAGSATISLGSSWSWSGSAPTLAKGLVTLAWYGTFGVANFTKFGD